MANGVRFAKLAKVFPRQNFALYGSYLSCITELYLRNEFHSLIYTIGQFHTIPINKRILSRIKAHLAVHWKDIGYELIAEHEVAKIASSTDDIGEKCFTMLEKWLETDSNPCYCQLFAALEIYKYFDLLKKVKEIITP